MKTERTALVRMGRVTSNRLSVAIGPPSLQVSVDKVRRRTVGRAARNVATIESRWEATRFSPRRVLVSKGRPNKDDVNNDPVNTPCPVALEPTARSAANAMVGLMTVVDRVRSSTTSASGRVRPSAESLESCVWELEAPLYAHV